MLPWKIEGGTGNMKTFNKNISVAVAAMMPDKATNRERVSGSGMDLALGWTVMDALANEWNLSNARAQAGEALDKIGNVYQILSADVNPYHDVTFGVYVEDKPDEREENLHLDLKRPDFPQGFTLTAILLCNDRKVFGVDQFLQDVPRYQDLTLSVPWLAKLRTKCPKCGTTLIWVHNQSLSDKALKNFTADMHASRKTHSLTKFVRFNRRWQFLTLVTVTGGSSCRIGARSFGDTSQFRVSWGTRNLSSASTNAPTIKAYPVGVWVPCFPPMANGSIDARSALIVDKPRSHSKTPQSDTGSLSDTWNPSALSARSSSN